MALRTRIVLAMLLVLVPGLSGCLTQWWNELDGPDPHADTADGDDPGRQTQAADNTTTPTNAPDEPVDPWQAAYDAWASCGRKGAVIPCPHPHPETRSPADTSPLPQRLSVRHTITDDAWTATLVDVRDGPMRFQDVMLTFKAGHTTAAMDDQERPDDGTLYAQDNAPASCADCPYDVRMTTTPFAPEETGYRLRIADADHDGHASPGDTFTIRRDTSTSTNTFDAPFTATQIIMRLEGETRLARSTDDTRWHRQAHLARTSDIRDATWNATILHDHGADTPRPSHARIQVPSAEIHIDLTNLGSATPFVRYAAHGNPSGVDCPADTCATATPPSDGPAYRIAVHDLDGNGILTLHESLQVTYDAGNGSTRTWSDAFPYGAYEMTLFDALRDAHHAQLHAYVYDGKTPDRDAH